MVAPAARGHLGSKNLYTQMIRQFFDRLSSQFPNALAYGFPGERPFKLGRYAGVYGCIEIAQEIQLSPEGASRWTRVKPVPLVSADLDKIWHRLKGQYDLCLVRDSAYVRWRYAEHPTRNYERVSLTSWGEVFGWAILQRQADKTQIIDVFCDRKRLPDLLACLSLWIQKQDKPPAVIWLPRAHSGQIRGKTDATPVYSTNMVRGFLLPTEAVRKELYYTMGDLDIF